MKNLTIDKTMSNDYNEDLDLSQTSAENTTENQEELDLFADDADEKVALNKKIATLEAQKEHWRKKALTQKVEPVKSDTTNEYLTKDEAVLIARGMELEDLEQLKLIQKGIGGSIKEAYDNPLFQSYMKQNKAEADRQKAQLGASGGGSEQIDEGLNKQDMTEAEHRELWKKYQK